MVRWIVISLIFLNVALVLWGGLGHKHASELSTMNAGVGARSLDMPGAKLVLLRERVTNTLPPAVPSEVAKAPAADENTPPAAKIVTPIADPDLCVLLGPFESQEAGKSLYNRLLAIDIQTKFAAIEVGGEPDYWVYLTPEASRDLAIVKLHELQDKKIDSFIIPRGELANGVSLGVFDKQENAESRKQSIIERGYDAKIKANQRTYLENWVVIYPEQAVKMSPQLYSQLRNDNNKLDLRKDQCSKVASLIDIQ
jgi:hypothetical protein